MKIKHYWDLLTGKLKVKNPAKLNWANVKGVAQAYSRQIAGFNLEPHLYEQIIWRRTVVNPECWELGYCRFCGCEILGKTMEDRACEDNCYPEMMDSSMWNIYKKENNIKLF